MGGRGTRRRTRGGWRGRWLAGAGLALAAGVVACAGEEPTRPNLLLVVVDTLRADHTEPYGYARATSPRLARLAAEGAQVAKVYAPSATTGPTHAGLFTGKHPRSVGVRRNAVVLDAAHVTLAELLRDAGWETSAFVSSFPLNHRFGFAQGFDQYDDRFGPELASVRHTRFEGFDVSEGFDRRAHETTARALDWLAEPGRGEKPFFLFVHYFDPHDPYRAPLAYQRRFDVDPDAPLREQAAALYDAEVAFTDAQIGRLLDGLAAAGLAEGTYVVLTADHGEGLFEHGHLFHDVFLYEEAVRVPLLVRGPGIAPALRLDGPLSLLDVMPTLLELLGVAAPPGLAGVSAAPALRGAATLDGERGIVLERRLFSAERVGRIPVRGEQLALRRGAWKYIEAPEQQQRELYDLEADPDEREDLLEREPEVARELAGELARWREAHPARAAAGEVSPEDRERLEALGYTH